MELQTIERFEYLHNLAKGELCEHDGDVDKGTHEWVEQQTLPFLMWDVEWLWSGDKLIGTNVHPIEVRGYGLCPEATIESLSCFDRRRHSQHLTSVDFYYKDRAGAEREAEHAMHQELIRSAQGELRAMTMVFGPDLFELAKRGLNVPPGPSYDWAFCERIVNTPKVDEAIRGLIDAGGHDDAVCLVLDIMKAAEELAK